MINKNGADMPLRVNEVSPLSPAEKLGIKKNALLISINGRHLEDILDYYYLIEEKELELCFQNTGEDKQTRHYHNNFIEAFGLEFQAPACKQCINKCVFCFVDQMPEGMRDSLYIKDDDFLFSFLYGNFVTLTNLTEHYLQKITEQSISPLYISVHTTNPELHRNMLAYNRQFDILGTLKYLADNNIDMHTQIVLVPGWNDQQELERTLDDLTNEELNISSIGIVPVGITKFRSHLTQLRTFNQEECQEVIELSQKYRENGYPYLYCSDEFFLKAEIEIPETDYYNEFEQIENGIGMIRKMWDNFDEIKDEFVQFVKSIGRPICFISSVSGEKALLPVVDIINQLSEISHRIERVDNLFFGETVTVSGLLTWTDVKTHINPSKKEIYAFADNFFNYDDKTLDNFTLDEIKHEINDDILLIHSLFEEYKISVYTH